MRRFYSEDIHIPKRQFMAVLFLVMNSISWYYVVTGYLQLLLGELVVVEYSAKQTMFAGYSLSIPLSSLIGVALSSKVRRTTILYLWIVVDVITILLPNFVSIGSGIGLLAFAIWLGVTVGFGLPQCLAVFGDSTVKEERGRVGSVMIFTTYLSMTLLTFTTRNHDPWIYSSILAVWRSLGLIALPFIKLTAVDNPEKIKVTSEPRASWQNIVLLYFIPWVMFSIIDGLDTHIFRNLYPSQIVEIMGLLGHLFGGFSSIFGGIMVDFIGRRSSLIFAMVAHGLGYATLALVQSSFMPWMFFSAAGGFAWGILTIIYVLVIWADLGPKGASEKYYALGMTPLFFSDAAGYLLEPILSSFSSTHLFSLAILLNFLAVVPLLFVQDTLPSTTREMRRMREYIRRAKQLVD